MNGRRLRLFFQTFAACASAALTVLTLSWSDWIEAVFGISPDRGGGAVEWLLAAGLFVVALTSSLAARASWRAGRSAAVASQ